MRFTQKEIREQLADLGEYRAEVQAERDELAETYDRMLDVGKSLDARRGERA